MSWKAIFLLGIMLTLTSACSDAVNDETFQVEEEKVMEESVMQVPTFVRTEGKDLYVGEDLINLRGVNVGGYLFQEFWMTPTRPSENIHAEIDIYKYLTESYGEDRMRVLIDVYQSSYFTEADFDNLASLGVNCIRLPFWYLNIVDAEGQVLENWYERFDWFIDEASKRDIYVILDFHGAPGSQNGSDHSGVDGKDDKEAASEFFYGDTETVELNQKIYFEIWELMAERYKDNPTVVAYDLLNEPYCTYRYSAKTPVSEMHDNLWSVYDEAYKKIRAIDQNHIIMMEATWDPVDLPNPNKYGWENVVYQYHNYLYDDYQNEQGQQIANMEKKVNLIKRAAYDVPVLMGEFNYFDSFDAWTEGLELLNNAGINWTIWTYKVTSDYKNWGLYHHTGGDVNIEKISDESIEKVWSKVGDSRSNQALIDVVEPMLKADFVPFGD